MRLLIKSMFLLVLLTSPLRAEEASFPLGFQTRDYVFAPTLKEPLPPARSKLFDLPEQTYNNCMPTAVVLSFQAQILP